MTKCKLMNIKKSDGSGFRSYGGEVEGQCNDLPEVGKSFIMMAKSLDFKGGLRFIQTSAVKEIRVIDGLTNGCEFDTESGSTYRFTEAN